MAPRYWLAFKGANPRALNADARFGSIFKAAVKASIAFT